ncbi:ATP-binding protein [Bacteroides cellulosilyticus]|jgi:signal transduction histidine kinase|uniref:ATP-binding protein n=1 Tax=Bacteroides cellulosilyticus TaxID=246787 RepID=UPI0018A0C01B|nr:ATP-binding protein [Bacteroides cellulosilyticus]MBX9087029.1 sensor histidine kinase [Bacteroides cellulosilyticus]QUT92011.1 Histidine kinase-, DNA gyrase B-, and HSP90-like ATPase [Bacteroides cellulosilyticus]
MKNTFLPIYAWIFLFFFVLNSCSDREERRILIVHSYEESYVGYPDFNRLIDKEFRRNGVNADIRIVYLDCEAFQEEPELKYMYHLLDSVSDGWEPEIILVNDDQAAYSLFKCCHPLAKEIPVVFGGVNYPNWELLKEYPNVTGFHDRMDLMKNIRLGAKLFGEDVELFTVLDSTYIDRQIRADIENQLKDEKVTCMVGYSGTPREKRLYYPHKEGYARFSSLSVRIGKKQETANFIWTLSKYSIGMCYLQMKRDYTSVNIGNICASPSLTAINEAFGYNEKLLGGYITTFPILAEEEVSAAIRILHGEKPSGIPVRESRKKYVVDWNVMQQRGISKESIPAECTIINIPFREEYPVAWGTGVVLIIILLSTLFVWLFFLYRREQGRKRRALYELESEKETLALAIEGSDTFAWKLENDHFVFEKEFWISQKMSAKSLGFEELLSFMHPDHWDEVRGYWKNISKAGKVVSQVRCDFNEKGYQWWEFRYKTILLPGGGYKAAGLLLNIQAIKDREQELEEARLLAEKAELKQSFLANMSHEIRTPLNAIVGFSNILALDDGVSPEERLEYIGSINKNSDLLLKLINDILELSRIESGYMSFEYEKCFVSELVDSIYMTHQMLISEQLEFIKELDAVQVEVMVDKGRLTQVITNFLNNASKFTKTGYIKLGYRYLSESDRVAIYVEDTGRGIELSEQKMIFSRFYKQDEFSQGAGLGLSICQVIVEKLRGKIELWSEPGKGSRFTVVLPVVKATSYK